MNFSSFHDPEDDVDVWNGFFSSSTQAKNTTFIPLNGADNLYLRQGKTESYKVKDINTSATVQTRLKGLVHKKKNISSNQKVVVDPGDWSVLVYKRIMYWVH